MYLPLQLLTPKRKRPPHTIEKKYDYKIIDSKTVSIRISMPDGGDCAETLVDIDILEKLRNEVTRIYILKNRADKRYISVSRSPRDGGKFHRISLSRYILGIGFESDLVADHINGDTLDNRRENLQAVSRSHNIRNSKQTTAKFGFRGVYYYKSTNKYASYLHLGTFDTPEEAHKAYKEAYEKIFPNMVHKNKW